MEYRIVILSADTLFARMLEVEFLFRGISVLSAEKMPGDVRAKTVLLDLDSAVLPDHSVCDRVIGFTRSGTLPAADSSRRCAAILQRPFDVDVLCREVLSGPSPATADTAEEQTPRMFLSDHRFFCGAESVSLSPNEAKILAELLSHRGKTVSRERLAEQIGVSSANKTDVYVCFLRKKLETLPCGRLIRTVRKQGYQIL